MSKFPEVQALSQVDGLFDALLYLQGQEIPYREVRAEIWRSWETVSGWSSSEVDETINRNYQRYLQTKVSSEYLEEEKVVGRNFALTILRDRMLGDLAGFNRLVTPFLQEILERQVG